MEKKTFQEPLKLELTKKQLKCWKLYAKVLKEFKTASSSDVIDKGKLEILRGEIAYHGGYFERDVYWPLVNRYEQEKAKRYLEYRYPNGLPKIGEKRPRDILSIDDVNYILDIELGNAKILIKKLKTYVDQRTEFQNSIATLTRN